MTFYQSGQGDKLIEPAFFPPEIEEFLADESALLERRSASYDLLVEVGCMHGRHLEWALSRDKRYLGLDVASRYVEDGRRLAAAAGLPDDLWRIVVGAAEDLPEVLAAQAPFTGPARPLLFFPFNSFGNMADAGPVADALARAGAPFLVSSYPTTPEATAVRRRYYEQCGYRDVDVVDDERGVCFRSSDGLRTIAYHPAYLTALFADRGIPIAVESYPRFGLAYTR